MYSHLIGRRLLDRANLRDGTPERTPGEFFSEVFFRLVFDDDQYLMTAGNSKFGQLVNNQKSLRAASEKEGRLWDEAEKSRARQGALADFHAAASDVEEPHSHLVLGGYARGSDGTTSGQVTSIDHAATADEVYLSWIGAAAGAGVAGGLVVLIDHDDVLDALLDGWAHYRRVLSESGGLLKANQIETWNGQWLRHRFSADFRRERPDDFVHGAMSTKAMPHHIETVPWARLLLALGRTLGDAPVPAYVYSIGQMNTTLGFVSLHLGATGVLRDAYGEVLSGYRKLFGDAADDLASPARLDTVYDTGAGFARVCSQGAIGLRAFEPAKLRDVLPNGQNKRIKPVAPEAAQTPLLYLTWILAMLGDQRHALNDRAVATAERLLGFETGALGGKTNLSKTVAKALEATSLTGLIDALTDVATTVRDASKTNLDEAEIAETLGALDDLVRACLDLSQERFQLFLALLRFQVALLRGKAEHAKKVFAA